MTKVPCRFYGQVTYGKQLQAYVFTDTNAKVPVENGMYVISLNQQKYFRYNQIIRQFRLIEARDNDWTTRYLLCKDLIFNQMTDQTYYVRQNRTELKLYYDQIIGQKHDSYDPESVQTEYLEKLVMTYLQDKDSYPCKQEYNRHMQEKPKKDKMGKLKRGINILRKRCTKSENEITKITT